MTDIATVGLVRGAGRSGATDAMDAVVVLRCPRCESRYESGDLECARCGIVFSKFKVPIGMLPEDVNIPRPVIDLWQKVLVDFAEAKVHDRFIEICVEQKSLAFAARKYQTLSEANPADELVRDMLKKVKALTTLQATVVKTEKVEIWKLRLFGIVIALGLVFMIIGFSFESLRNMVGFGATLIFLAVGSRVMLS